LPAVLGYTAQGPSVGSEQNHTGPVPGSAVASALSRNIAERLWGGVGNINLL
jgi:hypothetical protein